MQMNLFTNHDALMCRVFPTRLKGATLHWYTCLPKNSIDSFVMLTRKFRAHYAMSKPHHLTIVALANVRQEESKSLRSFTERFSSLSVRIRDLRLDVSLMSMIKGLKSGPFSNSLCKKTTHNTRRIKGEGCRLHIDGREDRIQGANMHRKGSRNSRMDKIGEDLKVIGHHPGLDTIITLC